MSFQSVGNLEKNAKKTFRDPLTEIACNSDVSRQNQVEFGMLMVQHKKHTKTYIFLFHSNMLG